MDADFITLDTDWAPDFAIDYAANLLINAGVNATWFITHDSPAIRRLAKQKNLFELGIHPNFLKGSSHGKTPQEVMKTMMKLVPTATAARSHSCFSSFRHLELMSNFGIKSDHTAYLPRAKNIEPVSYLTKDAGQEMVRVPFFWEDDYEILRRTDDLWLPDIFHYGLRVYDFHPIHLYLNTRHIDLYESLKLKGPLSKMPKPIVDQYRANGLGVRHTFLKLLERLGKTATISVLVDQWLMEK